MQFLVIGLGHLNNISNKRHNLPDHPLFLGHVFLSRAVLISCSFHVLFFTPLVTLNSPYPSLLPLIFVFFCLSTRISMFNINNTFLLSWFFSMSSSSHLPFITISTSGSSSNSACLSSLGSSFLGSPHTQPVNNM